MRKKTVILFCVLALSVVALIGKLAYNITLSAKYASTGKALLLSNDINKAITFLEKASRLDPRDIGIEVDLFQAYLKEKDYEKASKYLIFKLKKHSNSEWDFQRLNKLGTLYLGLKDDDRAADVYELLIERYSNAPLGYLGMSTVYEKKSDIKNAIKFKKRAIEVMETEYIKFPSNVIEEHKQDIERLRKELRK